MRKLIGVMLAIAALGVVGLIATIAIAQYWDDFFPQKLRRQTQYAGLKIGMSPQEVMYIKGYPPTVLGEEVDPQWKGFLKIIKSNELEKGKVVTDYRHWSYDQYKHNINVEFDKQRNALIAIRCYSEDKLSRRPSVGNVTDGTREQEALRRLRSAAEQRIDGVSKALRFPELGLKLTLTKEEVYIVEVYDQKSAP